MKIRTVFIGMGCSVALLLAACGQKQETASNTGPAVSGQKSGKYQGKPDTHPWDNETVKFSAVKMTKGDKAAWERQIKDRNQNQNEYTRAD